MLEGINEFLMKLLKGKTESKPSAALSDLSNPSTSFLPEIPISQKMQRDLDIYHLDFLVRLYMTSGENLPQKNKDWFAREISAYLQYSYPDLSAREYDLILEQIISMAKREMENRK